MWSWCVVEECVEVHKIWFVHQTQEHDYAHGHWHVSQVVHDSQEAAFHPIPAILGCSRIYWERAGLRACTCSWHTAKNRGGMGWEVQCSLVAPSSSDLLVVDKLG